MILSIEHHKTFVIEGTEEEVRLLVKSCRIWYKDYQGQLLCESLFKGKDQSFPTGFLKKVLEKLKKRKVEFKLEDKRTFPGPKLNFNRKVAQLPLWDHQVKALDAMEKNNTGIISSITGSGKSVMILEAFLAKRVKTLILVPTITIQKQLYKDFCASLGQKNVSMKAPKKIFIPTQQADKNAVNQGPKKMGFGYLDSFKKDEPVSKKKSRI